MKKNDFYVGYLPMPSRYKNYIIAVLALLFIFAVSLFFLLAKSQHAPHGGIGWDATGKSAIEVSGIVTKKPYDLLRFKLSYLGSTLSSSNKKQGYLNEVKTALLSSMIKTSVSDRLKNYYGKPIKLKGVMIQQDGRFLFSILDGDDAISEVGMSPSEIKELLNYQTKELGEVDFQGEIIDPKCYLGAMKRGDGKTHKSCAVLCLRGGIPPMFVVDELSLKKSYYLLTDEKGEPLLERIIDYVGDRVSVTGQAEKRGDLLVLKLNVDSIHRL